MENLKETSAEIGISKLVFIIHSKKKKFNHWCWLNTCYSSTIRHPDEQNNINSSRVKSEQHHSSVTVGDEWLIRWPAVYRITIAAAKAPLDEAAIDVLGAFSCYDGGRSQHKHWILHAITSCFHADFIAFSHRDRWKKDLLKSRPSLGGVPARSSLRDRPNTSTHSWWNSSLLVLYDFGYNVLTLYFSVAVRRGPLVQANRSARIQKFPHTLFIHFEILINK